MRRGAEFLGTQHAIMAGAMSWVSERHLVSAISNAGGFGVIACGAMTPELLDAEIAGTKKTVNAGTAWCAGAHSDKLTKRAGDTVNAGTAWCAGPHIDKLTKRAGDTINAGTAWCAGPHSANKASTPA
ncbi:MAG: nitronate monooxygenase [Massilia sp.]|nr:nitronate monooxygenase [Massilia sp.]